MRYVGQSYELTIPAAGAFTAATAGPLAERFHAEHDRVYGFSADTEPIECVSLRLAAIGKIAKPPLRKLEAGGAAEPKERRPVYFAESQGFVDCPIYDRYRLGSAARFPGPAVIEEFDSTTIVHPGYAVRVDGQGNLIIEREEQ
jgi:N-methylhydantoinase A